MRYDKFGITLFIVFFGIAFLLLIGTNKVFAADNTFSGNFDGSNDYGYDSDNYTFSPSTPFSIEFWITHTGTASDNAAIVSKTEGNNGGVGYTITYNRFNGILGVQIGDLTSSQRINVSDEVNLTTNTWYHVAVTYSGNGSASGVKIYLNGTALSLDVNTDALITMENDGNFQIGDWSNYSYFWKGLIDEVRVWDSEITKSQIIANSSTEIAKDTAGLIGYYKFNENGNDCEAGNDLAFNGTFSTSTPFALGLDCGTSTPEPTGTSTTSNTENCSFNYLYDAGGALISAGSSCYNTRDMSIIYLIDLIFVCVAVYAVSKFIGIFYIHNIS